MGQTRRTKMPGMTERDVRGNTKHNGHTAQAPKSSPLVLKRLRKDFPPPSETRLRWMLYSLMLVMICLGWMAGSTGPILPFLQEYYHVSYLIVSLIFIISFVGSLVAGLTNIYLTDRLGFGIVAPLGALSQAVAYILMGSGGPFALFAFSQVFAGFGFGIQDAQVNSLTSRLPSPDTKMFLVQSCFGLGATFSPLITTAFVQRVEKAYLYYFVSAALALATVGVLFMVFEMKTESQITGKLVTQTSATTTQAEDEMSKGLELSDIHTKLPRRPEAAAISHIEPDIAVLQLEGTIGIASSQPLAAITSRTHNSLAVEFEVEGSGKKLFRILRIPAVWTLLIYNFLYVGVEVSIGGWMTSFLIDERGGTVAAGYATTGFFAGITIGRIVLIPLTKKLGHHNSICLYSGITVALMIIIWTTKSLIGNAVCFAIIGLFLGPIFPSALLVISDILDDDIRGGIMGLMGTMGGAGAAAIPFLVGAISNQFGIWTLQPLMLSLMVADFILWLLVPRKKVVSKRS